MEQNQKLVELLKLVTEFHLTLRDGEYQILFVDAYDNRFLIDNSMDRLLDRALSIARVSERSAKKYAKKD